jgi:hypothetical protein
MHYTIEALMQGDAGIVERYRTARERWTVILQEIDPSNTEALAERLRHEQSWFEQNCGDHDRHAGQEIMAVSGIAYYYSTRVGFEENRKKAIDIVNAFASSRCSLEVHDAAKEIAQSYDLFNESSYNWQDRES